MIARCDLVRLPHMPTALAQSSGLSDAVVMVPGTDGVHVARYPSWAVCDGERRDKRRRKVDRQQGGKLAAMGEVRFETVGPGPEGRAIIAQMFAQRAERFKLQGIRDPFRCERVKGFYQRVLENAGGLLHVLRVDGDVVAVRYNIVAAGGLFSLITSMHCSPSMQAGSPGKQNLLHAMQSVFDDGYAFVDMGKGESEEKRLWCNEILALETAQLALSPIGRLAMAGLSVGERAKGSIKSRPEMFDRYRRLRSRVGQWGVRA